MTALVLIILPAFFHLFLLYRVRKGWDEIKPPGTVNTTEPVSIIIAARNEEKNLEKCLNALLQCRYDASVKIIVVNDRSTDRSEKILEQYSKENAQISFITIYDTPEGFPPKKYALTCGIETAETDILLFTDADCIVPENWIRAMAGAFRKEIEIVLGPGPYFRYPGLLNLLIQYETLHTAFLFLGLAAIGRPYMGLGRNIGYRKSFFRKNKGFTSGIKSLSGDDDLLVNHHGTSGNVRVELSAPVYSEPKISWGAWFRQKLRHGSAGKYYTPESIQMLAYFQISWMVTIFIGLVVSILNPIGSMSLLLIFFYLRFLCLKVAGKTQGTVFNIFVFLPLLEGLFFLYHIVVIPASLLKRPRWN